MIFKIVVVCLFHYIISTEGRHCELEKHNEQILCRGTMKSLVEKTGADNPFPQGLSANENLNPAFHDWDSDGRIDMLLGTKQSLIYFKNTGSGFVKQTTSSSNPFQAIGTKSHDYAAPVFVDLHSNGVPDLILHKKTTSYDILYRNIGKKGAPAFETTPVKIPGYVGASGTGSYKNSKFVDMDNDEDLDWVLASWQGTLAYLENIGNKTNPYFKYMAPSTRTNPLHGIQTTNYGNVEMFDLDKDGDYDIILGDSGKTLYYYENTGNNGSPSFTKREEEENPFYGLEITQTMLAPRFADISGTGRYDLIVGTKDKDKILVYHNIVDGKNQKYTEQTTSSTNPFYGVFENAKSSPQFYDYNNDGNVDLLLGLELGKIRLYLNNGTAFHNGGLLQVCH
jgi:hypothetical protein